MPARSPTFFSVFRNLWIFRKCLLQYVGVPAFLAGPPDVKHFLRVLALFGAPPRGKQACGIGSPDGFQIDLSPPGQVVPRRGDSPLRSGLAAKGRVRAARAQRLPHRFLEEASWPSPVATTGPRNARQRRLVQ